MLFLYCLVDYEFLRNSAQLLDDIEMKPDMKYKRCKFSFIYVSGLNEALSNC